MYEHIERLHTYTRLVDRRARDDAEAEMTQHSTEVTKEMLIESLNTYPDQQLPLTDAQLDTFVMLWRSSQDFFIEHVARATGIDETQVTDFYNEAKEHYLAPESGEVKRQKTAYTRWW
jgi:hypothetical protein